MLTHQLTMKVFLISFFLCVSAQAAPEKQPEKIKPIKINGGPDLVQPKPSK